MCIRDRPEAAEDEAEVGGRFEPDSGGGVGTQAVGDDVVTRDRRRPTVDRSSWAARRRRRGRTAAHHGRRRARRRTGNDITAASDRWRHLPAAN